MSIICLSCAQSVIFSITMLHIPSKISSRKGRFLFINVADFDIINDFSVFVIIIFKINVKQKFVTTVFYIEKCNFPYTSHSYWGELLKNLLVWYILLLIRRLGPAVLYRLRTDYNCCDAFSWLITR